MVFALEDLYFAKKKLVDVSRKEIVISDEFESLEEARNALDQVADRLFRAFYKWE